jgi:hypothetical protein
MEASSLQRLFKFNLLVQASKLILYLGSGVPREPLGNQAERGGEILALICKRCRASIEYRASRLRFARFRDEISSLSLILKRLTGKSLSLAEIVVMPSDNGKIG